MTRLAKVMLLASALALPLGGCGTVGDALDPTEWFSGDWFGAKKKLPGDRKPVFPEGVPGVTQGIPQDLVRGNPPPTGTGFADAQQGAPATQRAAAEPEEFRPAPREEAKPKPKAKANPKEQTVARQPTAVTVRRSPDSQPQQDQAGGAVQWPDPPPPPRTAQPGAVQWPDPPPLR